jgi:hypothetical protein
MATVNGNRIHAWERSRYMFLGYVMEVSIHLDESHGDGLNEHGSPSFKKPGALFIRLLYACWDSILSKHETGEKIATDSL